MGKKEKVEVNADKEGKNLLGSPTFKKLENGRYKCVETGHELPANARESYAQSKHCRLGLIDSALARNKPPLNMFQQDPASRSKLICKLTGHTVNKTEEHIWKHINGKKFLNMLEKKEAEAEKEEPNRMIEEPSEQKPEKVSKSKGDSSRKDKKKKKKKQEEEEMEVVSEVISEVRNSADKDSDSEEDDFWMPPAGERWDFDDGGDRWGSGTDSDPETDDANEADAAGEEGDNDAGELSSRTKRMSIEIGPSENAPRKKKKKTQST